MSNLYFSNNIYKKIALSISNNNMNIHSFTDSFFQLIHGLDYESLDILCDKICERFSIYENSYVRKDKSYEMTQNLHLSEELKEMIVDIAIECIQNDYYLGSKIVGNHNVVAWINHSYYVSECTRNLAWMLELDSEKARTYGLIHDYGRKNDASFNHVVDGFQELYDLGYKDEAVACLTHSFLNGERCANNEKALDGFYVDDYGNPRWVSGASVDDMTMFLENYEYSLYDTILNIADLMATSKGIASPYDRILDIATRRKIDFVNRGYFLSCLTNTLIDILKRIDLIDKDTEYIKASEGVSLSMIEEQLKKISDYFYVVYKQLSKERIKKKSYRKT